MTTLTIPIKTEPQNLAAMQFVTGVINLRSTLPILGHVLLRENFISATNLDVTLSAALAGVPPSDFTAVLDGKLLAKIARLGHDMALSNDGSKIISLGLPETEVYYKLPTLLPEDLPAAPKLKDEQTFAVRKVHLAEALKQVDRAISTDDSRYVLNGIFFEQAEDSNMTVVATDGRRLHTATFPVGIPVKGQKQIGGFILPGYAVPHLRSLLEQQVDEQPITFEVDNEGSLVRIEGERLSMTSRLIEGKFPNYRQVIPNPADTKIFTSVDVPAWIAALESVLPLADEAPFTVEILFSKDRADFHVNGDLGKATASLPIKQDKAEPIRILFDPSYLLDSLRPHLGGAPVRISIISGSDPCVVTTATTTAVIMPKRST